MEQNIDELDGNPFRYCGEYFDRETGTYYLRARYYDPKRGRFTQEDTLALNVFTCSPQILLIAQVGNKYVYCANNPVMYSDPSGNKVDMSPDPRQAAIDDGGTAPADDPSTGGGSPGDTGSSGGQKPNLPPLPEDSGNGQPSTGDDAPTQDAFDYDETGAGSNADAHTASNQLSAEEIAGELLLSPGNMVDGISAVAVGMEKYLIHSVNNAIRPANIGVGIFAKQQAAELAAISRGAKFTKNILGWLSVGTIAIDVGIGIYKNIKEESDTKEYILDAAVDVAISGGIIATTFAIGVALGSFVPGIGNVLGGILGYAVGLGLTYAADIHQYNGQTGREFIKESVNNLW